jgi:DNA-binding IclR family transcriptional regulator
MTSARRSPPTERVIAVLDHFGAHPDAQLGLSELARAVRLSKPTCLGILNTLVEGGYLMRDAATASYRIGPALVALGAAARDGVTAADVARRQLRALADRYATACTASAVVGEEVMVLAAVSGDPGRPVAPVGQRYPFAPPVGLMYVLWDSDEVFEAWLARPATLPVLLDDAHLRRVVAECRERGYLVEGLTESGRRLHTLMAGVAAYKLPPQVRELVHELASTLGERVYLGTQLAPRSKHPVNLIAAPTFDTRGRQELVLTLGVGGELTAAEIARRGAALVAVADAVTAEVGGHKPGASPPAAPDRRTAAPLDTLDGRRRRRDAPRGRQLAR